MVTVARSRSAPGANPWLAEWRLMTAAEIGECPGGGPWLTTPCNVGY